MRTTFSAVLGVLFLFSMPSRAEEKCPDLEGTFSFQSLSANCQEIGHNGPGEGISAWDPLLLPIDPVYRQLSLYKPGDLKVEQGSCGQLRFAFRPQDTAAALQEGALTLDQDHQELEFSGGPVKQWVDPSDSRLKIKRKGIKDYDCIGAWCAKLYPPRAWWTFSRTETGDLRIGYEYKRWSTQGFLSLTVIPQLDHRRYECVLKKRAF